MTTRDAIISALMGATFYREGQVSEIKRNMIEERVTEEAGEYIIAFHEKQIEAYRKILAEMWEEA